MESDSFERLYQLYYDYKRNYIKLKDDPMLKKERKEILKQIDNVKTIIDEKPIDISDKLLINRNYASYPDYNDPDFIYEITRRAEFFHCKNEFNILELLNKCGNDVFSLGNHQIFLKNFINRNTPYKSLLVFHGVGVGKTCSAITISNSFIDLYKTNKENKKIICLVSKNIQENWRNTFYNPKKGENQCTSTTYEDIINNIDSKKSKEKVRNKVMKDYYEFYGYQEFSNKVKNMINIYLKNKDRKEYTEKELIVLEKRAIKEYFSDRLFIIDEVHNLRDENISKMNKDESRDVLKFLDKVITYSENLRLVIMSATPMFNKAQEIQWILNMLLKNDNRPTIKKNELFNKKGKLNVEKLIKKSKGYISYLRGENPITFPLRLYPDINNDKNCLSKRNKNYPLNDFWGEKYLDDFYNFKDLKMYFSLIDQGSFQQKVYQKYIESLPKSNLISLDDQRKGVQISNIIYPPIDVLIGNQEINNYDLSNFTGGPSFLKLMKKNRDGYSYSSRYKSKVEPDMGPLFSLENISKISSKMYNLVNGIIQTKSEGIIFIYSEYITSGIIPLSFLLEHCGFEKYSGNILNYPEYNSNHKHTKDEPLNYDLEKKSNVVGDFKRAKYIILSGQKDLSPNNNEEIKVLTDSKNSDGSNIKIVIGSAVTSEGLDFKNIREIHILDPWFHLYKIEQIIGRGIRFCSHLDIEMNKRNVTVFLHVSGDNIKNESIDTYTYRIAEKKASEIGKVEMVLKHNAVDCFLNKTVNHIGENDVNPIKIITSRNRKIGKHMIYDKKFSKICSFSEKCDYNCNIANSIKLEDIKYDTFSIESSKELIQPIQKIILELFEIKNYYLLSELKQIIVSIIDTNEKLIYFSLDYFTKYKTTIWNKNSISGYLICKDDYYVFQPHTNSDEMLPLYYRDNDTPIKSYNYIKLNDKLFSNIKKEVKKVYYFTYDSIIESLAYKLKRMSGLIVEQRFGKNIKKKRYKIQALFTKENPLEKEQIFFDFYIDSLHFIEKQILLKSILKEKIEKKTIKDKLRNDIFEYFKKQIITKDKLNNYYLFRPELEICGFYLFDHVHFYDKKEVKKELDNIENDYKFYIYENEDIIETENLENGLLIKKKIIKSIKQSEHLDFKTNDIWSYTFKSDKDKRILKVVQNNNISNDLPGISIENISQITSIKSLIEKRFPENYERYLQIDTKSDKDKTYNTRDFLSIFIEIIMRNNQLKSDIASFIPYDVLLLKYIN